MQNKLGVLKVLFLACWLSGADSRGAVVMDQIGVASSYVPPQSPPYALSQFNEAGFEDYDAMALDDFTLGAGWRITQVEGLFRAGDGFAAFATVAGYRVSIFSSVALAGTGLEGDVANLFVAAGSGASVSQINGGDLGLVSLGLDVTLPGPGTYWIGLAPVITSSDASGDFYLLSGGAQGGSSPGNQNGRFANPDDGYGLGALTATTLDYAYRVTAVPEPGNGGLVLLAAGLVLLRRSRRFSFEKMQF